MCPELRLIDVIHMGPYGHRLGLWSEYRPDLSVGDVVTFRGGRLRIVDEQTGMGAEGDGRMLYFEEIPDASPDDPEG